MADGKVVISTALDNSGLTKGIKGVVGALGGLTKVVAGATATITAAFGAAAVAITKQATDAYADYEQLLGGIETLFKDSANKVVEYAEDAFYTVGISANEYMETVTSFSASLISALGGDTAKAADVANMALADMADNANKMGTPLESIKNAYQGFAKQNYTMLDNLKLGYGGTKTEMERLLADAQKLTGIKYNINNLADVYNAIHAIQVEMGIAGTTAKEAEKTITGSANMTKAAWKNVLTAIAGGGDLDKAINNLVYSVSRYFDNIVPVVERSLAGIGELIEKIAPQLVQTVAAALIKAIPDLLNAVYQMIIGLAKGIYDGITALLSGSVKEISAQTSATKGLVDGFGSAANSAQDLANATEEAGKAAKKSLAGFDELNKLQSDSGSVSASGDSNTAVGGATSSSTSTTITADARVTDAISPKLQAIVDKLKELFEPLKRIDFTPVIEVFGRLKEAAEPITKKLFEGLEWAWYNIFVPLAEWTIEDVLPAFLDLLSGALEVLNSVLEALQPLAEWLWDSFLEPIAAWTGGVIVEVLGWIADGLTSISDWITNHQSLVEGFVIVVGSMAAAFRLVNTAMTVWNNLGAISTAVTAAFGTAVNFLTSPITLVTLAIGALIATVVLLVKNWDTVKEVAGKVWEGIKTVWNSVADWFREHVTEPIADFFKGMVNGIIGFINGMISTVISGINFIIHAINKLSFNVPDWVPGIGGETWGFKISEVIAPQIPYLAKGAVLPANKPFMAVVGDQKHGTNVEAPLATIREALALELADIIPAMLAGFERVVEEQQATRRAVGSIEIGDTTIGQAVARYNAKMAIIRGGSY